MYLKFINIRVPRSWRATYRALLATVMCLIVPLANGALPVGWKDGQLAAVKGSWSLNSSRAANAGGSSADAEQSLIVQLYSYNSRIPLSPVSINSLDELQVIESASDDQWLAVTVNSGFPGWVAAANVIVDEEQFMRVTAQKAKLLITPEQNSRYLITLRKDYQAPVLSIAEGWVQTLAPSGLRFRMKASEYRNLLVTHKESEPVIPAAAKQQSSEVIAVSKAGVATNAAAEQSSGDKPGQQDVLSKTSETSPTVRATAAASTSVSEPVRQIQNSVAETVGADYRLTPGDVITISVFGEPDMTVKEQRIPEAGTISFPLIGAINVKGRSPIDVQNDIETKLAAGYLRDPEVNIAIVSYRPLYVRGAVISPGAFEFTEGLTVTKVLALAGGVGKQALRDAIKLYRGDQLFLQNLTVDSQVLIQPGDIVVVDEADETLEEANRFVYLHGEVNNPGGYPFRRGLTVEKAIALAGGFGPRASRKKINISREVAGQEKPEKLKKVELYQDLQPGDVISVGASWF